jgi:hypothetical protein
LTCNGSLVPVPANDVHTSLTDQQELVCHTTTLRASASGFAIKFTAGNRAFRPRRIKRHAAQSVPQSSIASAQFTLFDET